MGSAEPIEPMPATLKWAGIEPTLSYAPRMAFKRNNYRKVLDIISGFFIEQDAINMAIAGNYQVLQYNFQRRCLGGVFNIKDIISKFILL